MAQSNSQPEIHEQISFRDCELEVKEWPRRGDGTGKIVVGSGWRDADKSEKFSCIKRERGWSCLGRRLAAGDFKVRLD